MTGTPDPYDLLAAQIPGAEAARIARFWEHFAAGAAALKEVLGTAQGADPSTAIMEPLAEIHPDLMWEFGSCEAGHELTLTAEWRDDLRVLARALVAAAPRLPGWVFTDARPALDPDVWSPRNFKSRTRRPFSITGLTPLAGARNRVDLAVTGEGDADGLIGQALITASMLLGERVERDWLGDAGPGEAPLQNFDASRFVAAFAREVEVVRDRLPDRPYRQCNPDHGPFYLMDIRAMPDGLPRGDLETFTVGSEVYANAALLPGFASANHSRHGEWFGFLRVPHDGHPRLASQVEARAEIEFVLHGALAMAGIGGYVAGGHGREAVYVDFAVTDPAAGLSRLAEVFAEAPWAQAATVHFLDAGLPQHPLALTAPLRPKH